MAAETIPFIFFAVIDLLCIFAVIFVERKNPAATMAWVLVLIFVPLLGFVAYLMFGSGFHINKKKRYALKRISDVLYKRLVIDHISCGNEQENPDNTPCARLIQYLQNDGGNCYTRDNAASLFTDGLEMFQQMKEDMSKAQKHIHMLYYIFRNDPLGRDIVALLTRKARNGVAVRVIYDSLGSILSVGSMFKPLIAAGGKVEAFSPLVFSVSSQLRLNYRNHRKITVIDGEVGYVGGMNIGAEYIGRHKKLHPWRDTQLRLTGTSVGFLQERFLMDWISTSGEEAQPKEILEYFAPSLKEDTLGVQIVSSGPDTETSPIKNGLLEMLYSARKNVFIQTPYFTPDDSFTDALRIAAAAGVDVRLMIPGISDSMIVSAATYSYAWQLLDAGVKVYRYQGFLHAKTMVVDGFAATIGTVNIGNRSFALNFEINAFVYDSNFAAECEKIFLHDQTNCLELNRDWFHGRNHAVRASYGLCRLFAPLI